MKKIFLLFFLFPLVSVDAQDYQNICSPGTTLYKNNYIICKAFRRDSVLALGGGDTLFISYPIIRYDSPCYDTTTGSILGREVIKTASGWFWFFNAAKDTIKINSLASLNQSWKFCILWDKSYIEAKVTNIIIDSVLGTTDSVKVISFQAKDSLNNDIAHFLNQKFIKLSKHYGLSMMIEVFGIPNTDTTSYQLAGKSDPVLGVQNLLFHDVFDYKIGDEFQYYYGGAYFLAGRWHADYGTPNEIGYMEKIIKKILNKTWHGVDTVVYTEAECSLYSTDYGSTWKYYHDTITETISNKYYWLAYLPDEFIRKGLLASVSVFLIDTNRNRRTFKYPNATIYKCDTPSCWRVYSQTYGGPLILEEGLGITEQIFTQFVPHHFLHYGTVLVYYKKGSETWGIPLAADCSALSGISELSDPIKVSIQPNPADAQTLVTIMKTIPGETIFYTLLTINGTKVTGGRTQAGSFVLMRNGLPSGLYLLVICDADGNVKARTRVLFK